MDNLTHSVVGLGIGALIDRSVPPEVAPEAEAGAQRKRTRLLLTIACVASNVPDLDLVLTRLLEKPLGYLLHHRGHTHTLLGGLGEIVLLLGLVWLLWPSARHLLRASRRARLAAAGAACVGVLLHIAMDGLNVYGVHPFWPFDTRWYYGDLVFIVEPVFWIAFGIPLAAMVRGRVRRVLLLALLVAVPAAVTVAGVLQWGSLAGLLALAGLLDWIARRQARRPDGARGRAALAAGLAAALAFVAVQAVAMHAARVSVATAIARLDPGERLLDTALSAYPANPLCWSFVTVATNAVDGTYHLRRGLLSVAPGVNRVAACPAPIAGPAGDGGAAGLAWQSEERDSLAHLRDLQKNNCHFNAWMRFARAPSIGASTATDARWSPPGHANFSTIDYAALGPAPCPHPVPDWRYPRSDLLGRP
ncbi:metal-dependent hydrolase [Massilia rhizosphaerae]|uniref:metal-dependent hydrolase n=1 Tax=Massilia rhizosphaerae TaxID=2784389 RepID=UPI0018DB858C|nr:metal-dependent hydrolase [Massilia rhizosphaerae]